MTSAAGTPELPAPCPDCEPYGGAWRLVTSTDGTESLGRCLCDRGRALKALRAATEAIPAVAEPQISQLAASYACEILAGTLPFFPKDASVGIVSELMSLCDSEASLNWLVTRMSRLYSRWPGTREMRILYCSSRRPLSGEYLSCAGSEHYPDGFPPESPAEAKQLEAGPMLALPPGHVVSASPTIDRAVQELAEAKDLNRVGLPTPKVHDVPVIRNPSITQADIDRAVEEHRLRQAQRELTGRNL